MLHAYFHFSRVHARVRAVTCCNMFAFAFLCTFVLVVCDRWRGRTCRYAGLREPDVVRQCLVTRANVKWTNADDHNNTCLHKACLLGVSVHSQPHMRIGGMSDRCISPMCVVWLDSMHWFHVVVAVVALSPRKRSSQCWSKPKPTLTPPTAKAKRLCTVRARRVGLKSRSTS